MNPDFFFPAPGRLLPVFATFAVLLIFCHVILVKWLRLSKVAWKYVDYVWLSFAALGLVSAAGEVRKTGAATALGAFEGRASSNFQFAKSLVESYARKPGALCRTFTHSESSPPLDQFNRTVKEYELACEWITAAATNLSSMAASPLTRINQANLPPKPAVTDEDIGQIFLSLDSQFQWYNESIDDLEILRARAKRTPGELYLVFCSPFLLAFALALRITKVTGEIGIESTQIPKPGQGRNLQEATAVNDTAPDLAARTVPSSHNRTPLLLAFASVIALWFLFWWGVVHWIPKGEDRGHFGDQFGAVNALFTGLAFAGVVLTLYQQHSEAKRQEVRFRNELAEKRLANDAEETRFQKELARREKEFEKQVALGALTASAEHYKELWLHCERQKVFYRSQNDMKQFEEWAGYSKARYDEMMVAFEQVRKLVAQT